MAPEPGGGEDRFASLRELLKFLLPYKGRMLGAGIALLFTAGITLVIGQGVRLVIDEGFVSGSTEQLGQAVGILALLAVCLSMGTYIRFYLVSWLGERVSADIRKAVFNHIVELHPSFFEMNRSGEITSRLTTDTTLLQSIVGSSFSMALRSAITAAGALIMLVVTNVKLTAIILLAVPLVLLPVLMFGRRVRALSRTSQDRVADVGSYAGEIIQQIKTVQSYTREREEKQAFGHEVDKAFDVARRRIAQRGALMAAVILMVFGALSAMLWVGGTDVMSGVMSPGELGAFVFYALVVAAGVATLSEVWGELQRAAGATDRLIELLHAEKLILASESSVNNAESLCPELAFQNVNFSYPSRPNQRALNDYSLRVSASSVVALVGPSGAGKSTVFELIQRFYDPQTGTVNFGGQDIRQLEPQDLRHQFALVSQQPAMFSADVRHNIGYGVPGADLAEIQQAARLAYAHDFIEQLPEGYASYLGEQGVRLSGGQKQRIAIARAILKNPRVLLLDEATSALDTESEGVVQQALKELMRDRTTIIIAHRLSTVVHADKIVVMDQGCLVAEGTHQELLRSSELYARLATSQFNRTEQAA